MRAVASWLSEPHRHLCGQAQWHRCLGFTRQWGRRCAGECRAPTRVFQDQSVSLWSSSGDPVCWEPGRDTLMPRGVDAGAPGCPQPAPGPHAAPCGRNASSKGGRGVSWAPLEPQRVVAGVCWGA